MTTPRSGGRRTLIQLLLSSTRNPINTSVIAVALVPIGVALDASPDRTVSLVAALYIVSAAFQPVVGQLVDRFGVRHTLLVGPCVTLAAVPAALIPVSLSWLIAVRVLIGIGTCAGFPAAMRVLQEHTDEGDIPCRMLALLCAT